MKVTHFASAAEFASSPVNLKERGISLRVDKWRPGNMTGFFVSPLGHCTIEVFPYHTVVYDGNRKDVVLEDTGGTLAGFLASQK
jgi:hypothetical protein